MCPMINGVGGANGGHGGSGILQSGNSLQTSIGGTNNPGSGNTAGNGDRLDASSDSAVSSMGSERVPSLSDGEWNDGSDSAQEYNNPYDYSYNNNNNRDGGRSGPVAQKKHQMFGKRNFSDGVAPPPHAPVIPEHIPAIKYEYDPYGINGTASGIDSSSGIGVKQSAFMQHPDIKYAPPYAIDFGRPLRTAHDLVNHNHSYTLTPQTHHSTHVGSASNGIPRSQTRDKKSKKPEEEHLTRDEKRARQMSIPITVHDIINLPMDEFNERLSKYDLSESQLSLIRDIRRRGKNKVAAQNCRKRKLDQITSLAEEVTEMKKRKERLLRERDMAQKDRLRVKDKYAALYRHVTNVSIFFLLILFKVQTFIFISILQNLRDADGNPCSSNQYNLQLSGEGNIILVPRTLENSQMDPTGSSSLGSTNAHQTGTRGSSTAHQSTSNSNVTHPSHPHSHLHHPQQHHNHHHHHLQQQQQQQQQGPNHPHYPQHQKE